jgi:hypothetical protein
MAEKNTTRIPPRTRATVDDRVVSWVRRTGHLLAGGA